ncbi:hypothetical protein [Herbaspirillum huttiense]|uniref:hypothetical protein n=1 Tax=Herbaspirillum huttiense TaxID=863372 RepID=UPI003F378CB6
MFEAYKIGIRIQVLNFASQGLAMLGADLMKTHGLALKLEDKLKAVKIAGIGLASAKMGDGMLGFLEKSVNYSKEYTRQLSLMKVAGMSQKDIAEATAAAWKTASEVPTSKASENLAALRELRSVFGLHHMEEAYRALPLLQRTAAVIEAQTGKSNPHLGFNMVKATELMTPGAMTYEKLEKGLNLQARALIASGGTIDDHDFLMAAKYAKSSSLTMSDEYKYMILPTLMAELKGKGGGAQSAGTITERLRAMIVGGQIPKHDIQTWLDAGLLDPSKVVNNKHGIGSKLLPGAVYGSGDKDFDLYTWAQKYGKTGVENLMKSRGLTEEQAISALTQQVNKNFGLSTFLMKTLQFERDKELIQATPSSYAAYQELLKTNPDAAQAALRKKYEEAMGIIGYQILPTLIPYMVKFAELLSQTSQWMKDNQGTVKTLVMGFAALAAVEAVVGRVLMYGAFIKFVGLGPVIGTAMRAIGTGIMFLGRAFLLNPIGLAITGIAAAAFLLWKNWDTVGPWLQGIWDGIKNGVSALVEWFASKWKWFTGLFGGDSPKEGAPGTVERERDKFISPREARVMLVNTQINLDGRPMANSLASYLVREVVRPTGGSAFDVNQAMPPPGYNYAK